MMSDTIRCPMCGASNPADQEECRECGARLKPLILHPQGEGTSPRGEATGPSGPKPPPKGSADLLLGRVDASEEEDLPQWLRELAGEEVLDEKEATPETEDLVEDPDLLGRLSGWSGDEEPSASPGQEAASAKREKQSEEPSPPGDRFEEPQDWLKAEPAEGPSSAEPASTEEDLPDWWAELTEEPEASSAGEKVVADEEEGLPNWLSDAAEGPETPQAEGSSPEDEEEVLPAWLGDLEEMPAPSGEAASPSQEEDLPDWLSGPEEPPSVAAPSSPQAPSADQDDRPDWLRDLEEAPEEASVSAPTPSSPAEEKGLPSGADAKASEATPDWLTEVEQDGAVPDWLAEVAQEGEDEAPALPVVNPFDVTAPPSDEEALSALGTGETTEEEEAALPAVPGAEEEAFALNDLPDWLDNLAPEALAGLEEEEEGLPAGETGTGDLAPGQLPDWLEAIRPDEVALESVPVAVEEESGVVETQGPLAGLSGVLPAEILPRPRKTGQAAARLNLREEEARYAEILQTVVAEEKQVTPPPHRWRWLPQRLLRIVLALVLLLVAWLPSAFGGLVPPLPTGIPPEVMAANRIVSQLPDRPAVLLAVDYNPAWQAEMESAAAPLVEHLMVRGARLVVISTQPLGPALADHFLHGGPLAGYGYVEGQQYVNLGYLAGGRAGLQGLALSPTRAAPRSINGYAAWKATPLAGVRQINDFDLVVVVSDDPDVARAWIEQVQPHLTTTPLILVVSAQAEPLVRPYYESQPPQVQGLVTGLMGGLAYMRLTGRVSEGVQYWGGFTWGIWAAILLLVVGGVYNLVLGLRARRQTHG